LLQTGRTKAAPAVAKIDWGEPEAAERVDSRGPMVEDSGGDSFKRQIIALTIAGLLPAGGYF
jgi:hypothetical protein